MPLTWAWAFTSKGAAKQLACFVTGCIEENMIPNCVTRTSDRSGAHLAGVSTWYITGSLHVPTTRLST